MYCADSISLKGFKTSSTGNGRCKKALLVTFYQPEGLKHFYKTLYHFIRKAQWDCFLQYLAFGLKKPLSTFQNFQSRVKVCIVLMDKNSF